MPRAPPAPLGAAEPVGEPAAADVGIDLDAIGWLRRGRPGLQARLGGLEAALGDPSPAASKPRTSRMLTELSRAIVNTAPVMPAPRRPRARRDHAAAVGEDDLDPPHTPAAGAVDEAGAATGTGEVSAGEHVPAAGKRDVLDARAVIGQAQPEDGFAAGRARPRG